MTPEQMQRAYELFEQALERPPEECATFLNEACGDDSELRAQLESLLEHDSRVPDDFMHPPQSGFGFRAPRVAERHDPRIGVRATWLPSTLCSKRGAHEGSREAHRCSFAAMTHVLVLKGGRVVTEIVARRAAVLRVAILLIGLFLTSCTTPLALHEAAARGHASQIDRCMKRGMSINAQDDKGNTPLHYAYFHNREDVVDRLIAYGADPTIRNEDGDTPSDMREIGKADHLIRQCAQLLDRHADWTQRSEARRLYDALKSMDGNIVIKAIVRQVIDDENRLRVLLLAVKLGISGSEERLNNALQTYGDKSMAEDYLNSGSQLLYAGGQRWAARRGYTIGSGTGSHRVAWGRF